MTGVLVLMSLSTSAYELADEFVRRDWFDLIALPQEEL